MSSLLTSGTRESFGRVTAETLSRTSLVASSIFLSRKNFTIMMLTPSLLVDVMLSTPPIRLMASSSLSVTCDSMVLGSAPG